MLKIVKNFLLVLFVIVSMSAAAMAQDTSININSADAQQMATLLTGIGKVKAEAIIALREELGGYTDMLQLLQVKGIGPKILELNQDMIALE